MNSEHIIQTLKDNYTRDIRKQLVKSILSSEKNNDKSALQRQYNLMNQIFSYVLKECNWDMPSNSNELDNEPLNIMKEVFPKLDTTKWFTDQLLVVKRSIDVVMDK